MTEADGFDDILIGGSKGRDARGLQGRAVGGSEGGLSFSLEWPADAGGADGTLRMMLRGSVVWGDEEDGLRDDWSGMLEHLADSWNALRLEQGYPSASSHARPSAFVRNAPVAADAEKGFIRRHDLAAWRNHPSTPPFYVVRQGNMAALECGSEFTAWPMADVLRSLEGIGNVIANRLHEAGMHHAVSKWHKRHELADAQAVALVSGRSHAEAGELLRSGIISRQTVIDLARDTDEVLAAARMMGPKVRLSAVVELAQTIRSFEPRPTPALDRLSVRAIDRLREVRNEKPHVQGHALAAWLRDRQLPGASDDRFDVNALLEEWGVPVQEVDLPTNVEAICFWGGRHGPAVLIALHGAANQGKRRATLAHEACHLLVDRGRELTVADVYGGLAPKVPEQRANAFAAELLLPREAAGRVYRQARNLQAALAKLMNTHEVSQTLAARQLLNCELAFGTLLLAEDKRSLEVLCRERPGS